MVLRNRREEPRDTSETLRAREDVVGCRIGGKTVSTLAVTGAHEMMSA